MPPGRQWDGGANPDTLVEAVQSVIKQAAQAANLDQGNS